jgi:hypothetical protein
LISFFAGSHSMRTCIYSIVHTIASRPAAGHAAL